MPKKKKSQEKKELLKLNLGCGGDIREGWINIDLVPNKGVDVVMDINASPMPNEWNDNVSEMYMSHILEHLDRPLFVMENLYRIAAPNCKLIIRVPYGSSDNAWEDPTHVRPYFMGSFWYFSQAPYVKNSYGYLGDWQTEEIILRVYADKCDSNEGNAILEEIKTKRNMVAEMIVEMRAVKPLRQFQESDKTQQKITLQFV